MGFWIKMFVEKKIKMENGKSIWITADKWFKNEDAILYPDALEPQWIVKAEDAIYSERNYELFAILGFYDEVGFVPISDAKGLPRDVSFEVRSQITEDAIYCSWLTLNEILDFDWRGQTVVMDGYVDEIAAKRFYETGEKPKEWAQYSNLEGWVRLQWEAKYYELCDDFLENSLPKLRKVGKPEDVRIVFWFV